jgi:uncharacterized protein
VPDVEHLAGPETVEVRRSDIAGRGLFATVDLPAGTVVLRVAWAADDDGRVDELGVRFPNHSCDANLGWRDARTLVTMTDVSAGAELLTDYAMSLTEPGWLLRCHCPSYRCRQMVEGSDWRIPQLQQRYAGWWALPVRRLLEATA